METELAGLGLGSGFAALQQRQYCLNLCGLTRRNNGGVLILNSGKLQTKLNYSSVLVAGGPIITKSLDLRGRALTNCWLLVVSRHASSSQTPRRGLSAAAVLLFSCQDSELRNRLTLNLNAAVMTTAAVRGVRRHKHFLFSRRRR